MVGNYNQILSILLIIAAVTSLYLGAIVLRAEKTRRHKWFFVISLSAAIWASTNAIFTLSYGDTQVVAALVSYSSAAVLAIGFLEFCFAVVSKKINENIEAVFLSIGTIAAVLSAVPGVLLLDVTDNQDIITRPLALLIYGIFLMIALIGGIVTLLRSYKCATVRDKRRIMVLMAGLFIGATIGVSCNLILPIFGNYRFVQVGPQGLLIFIGTSFYAIAKHGLFDVKSAVVRTIGYTLTLSAMVLAYMVLAYGVSILLFSGAVGEGVGIRPIDIVITILLALLFQPIKDFFDKLTNKIFYRSQYDQEDFFLEFGRILSYDTDLRLLLRQASRYIAENLKSESVFFAIPDRGSFGINKSKILPVDIEMLSKYYRDNHEFPSVLSVDMVQSDKIRQILGMYQIYMILPLILQEQIIGYLFIGEHKSRGYTTRDIKTIESIANELAISVQNSLSVEEIRELNESLKNGINTATKELRASNNQLQKLDEAKNDFISMASHQLRTPLTSIKGYLDMVIEGDLGKISPTQKAVLSEAFTSSERMVNIINDFLNVSRLQTGKFVIDRSKNDLKEVLREQIGMLRVMAKQHDLKIVENIDETIPIMNVDVDKLQQVIVNFIDNAIYYSKPGTSIRVKLEKQKDQIIFTVKDTGIGVPKSEQSQLFGRFFRASNARQRRPDGTGVGLFLAKKVVLLHGGQIIFESQEGKGSTFGFSLPIKQPKTNS